MVRTAKSIGGRQDATTKEDGPKKAISKEPHPQMGIKSTMKENFICSVLNCKRKASGQSLGWRDQWGPPGLRCATHGGGVTCCVPGCTRAMTQICTRNDDYGSKGPRCSEHLMRIVADSVDHIPLDHYNEDGKRGDDGLKAPLINASEEKISVGREDKGNAAAKGSEEHFGYVDDKGNPVIPRKYTKPLLSKKIEDFQKCSLPNCQEFAKGDALQSADQYGPPGYRCEKHGGYIACGVEGCNNPRWIIGTRADAWGKRGPRCSEHSQPVPSDMFPENKLKKKKGDGMVTVSVELPKRTPKAENPCGGILPPAATPTAYGGPPKLGTPPPPPEVNVNEIEPPAREFMAHGPYIMPPISPALIDELAGCRPKAGRSHVYPKRRASKKNRVDDWGSGPQSPLPLKVPTNTVNGVNGVNGKVKAGISNNGPMPIMNLVQNNVPKAPTFSTQVSNEPPKKKGTTPAVAKTGGVRGPKKADNVATTQESGQSKKNANTPQGIPSPASNPEAQGAAPPARVAQKKKSQIPTQEDQANNQSSKNVRTTFTLATKSVPPATATKQQLKITVTGAGAAGGVTNGVTTAPSKGTKRSISSPHSPSSPQATKSQATESVMKAVRPLKKQKQEVETSTGVKGGAGAPKAAAMKKLPA